MPVAVSLTRVTVEESVPAYGAGWNVIAHPDGKILVADGATYPYLFWEGRSAKPVVDLSTGSVVATKDVRSFLAEALAAQGLKQSEAKEFISYWAPRLTTSEPYVYIYFMPRSDYDKLVPMNVTPIPDTMIRVYMLWKPLDEKIAVTPQRFVAPARVGFTVVEWGGDRSPLH
jgi:hypothetical protein